MKQHRILALVVLPLLLVGCEACEEEPNLTASFAICVHPEAVDFGAQPIRSAETRTLVVSNCGQNIIDQLLVEVLPQEEGDTAAAAAYIAVATEVAVPIEPGARFDLPVRFRPREQRAYLARLSLEVPESNEGELAAVTLAGSGAPIETCDIVPGSDPLVFADTPVGDSEEAVLTLTNQGSATCGLSGARVVEGHDVFAVAEPPQAELGAGAAASMRVRFSPLDAVTSSGRLALVLDGEVEIEVDLSGTGFWQTPCRLEASPAGLVLPRASLNHSTTSASTVVSSVGVDVCTVAGVAVSAGGDDFSLLQAPAASTALAPGQSAVVEVQFAPAAAGNRTGAVTVSTAEGTPLLIPLTGFADPTPACALQFDPTPIGFASLAVGLAAETDVTITNVSSLDCNITGARLSDGSRPDFELLVPVSAGTLLPGQSTSTRVRFTPVAAAPAVGQLLVALAEGPERSVELIGFGDYAELVLTPTLRFFGVVTEGCVSRTHDTLLTNVGAVAARIDFAGFGPSSDPNFEILAPIATGTLIAAGQSITMPLRMAAGPAPGVHAGTLEVMATGATDPRVRAQLFGSTESVEDARHIDVYVQRERPTIDILFVVDNSGSMQQEQQSLAQNFTAFIQFTSELDIDYHIGVTTTDTARSDAGALVAPVIANTGPGATSDPIGEFIAAVNVGTNGSATEKGLHAAVLALTEPLVETANAGFLRDTAM
ncbi:MAG: choice-of-anchor D domain-containing protein, partial [Deltaproteobacteria bacterium]|nr:choice-of-anchor D domain-containing protein [Deltaproteobacteria bacterium]